MARVRFLANIRTPLAVWANSACDLTVLSSGSLNLRVADVFFGLLRACSQYNLLCIIGGAETGLRLVSGDMVPWGENGASVSIGLAAVGDTIGDGLAACELAIIDPDTLLGGILCGFMMVDRKKFGVRPTGLGAGTARQVE